jgi:hypothetical protein
MRPTFPEGSIVFICSPWVGDARRRPLDPHRLPTLRECDRNHIVRAWPPHRQLHEHWERELHRPVHPSSHFRRSDSSDSPDSILFSLPESSSHPGGTNAEPRHQHIPFCNELCRMRIPPSAVASRSHRPKITLRTVHLPTEAFSFRACRDSPPCEGLSNTLFYRCSFNPSRTSPDEGKPSRYASSRAEPLSPKRKTFESRSSMCRHVSETESFRPHCSMSELAKSPNGSRHPERTGVIQMDTTRFFLPPAP